MTASQNNLPQQLPDHQRELGTENVKVQAGGNGRDFSEFLSPELTHSGASPHHARTALQGDRKHPDFPLTGTLVLEHCVSPFSWGAFLLKSSIIM